MDLSKLSNDELKELRRQTINKISQCHNMQLAKKILLNSCYGAMSNEFFHFYSDILAESITLSGQLSIRFIAGKLNEFLNKKLKTENVDYVIAIDTDSNYITLNPLVEKFLPDASTEKIVDWIDKVCKEILEPYINSSYQELADMMNAFDQKMKMKREAIADNAIWTGKKRYIMNVWDLEGVRYKEPELKVTGIAVVSSSTPYICRQYLKDAIKIIMNKSETDLWRHVEECQKDFFSRRFDEIGKPTSVKGLDEYSDKNTVYKKGSPYHVKASLVYNDFIKKQKIDKKFPAIRNGDKIKVCYMKTPNILQEKIFAVPQILPEGFGLEQYIDYTKQFKATFLTPLEIILDVIEWTAEERISLDSFFRLED